MQVEPSSEVIAQAAEVEAAKRRFFGLEPDAWVAVCTGILALFTAGLFAATLFLWSATRGLAKSTEDLAMAAGDQVAEMRKAQDLAERQHELAEKQFLLAGRQCDLAEKQHGLQRAQYLAEHRPRIKIRSVGIVRDPADAPFDGEIKGSVVIWNDGDSDAVILRSQYMFLLDRKGLPMVPPLEENGQPLVFGTPLRIEGHGSHLVPIQGKSLGDRAMAVLLGVDKFYFIGAILYRDADLKERWMGFGRQYIPSTHAQMGGEGRFVPVDNADYEYSD